MEQTPNHKRADFSVANEVARLSWKDKLTMRAKIRLYQTAIICVCIAVCVGSYFLVGTMKHAIDRNFDYLESLVIEYETEIIETGENGIIIQGNENITAGGDVSGANQKD